jgi:hypothetical protein
MLILANQPSQYHYTVSWMYAVYVCIMCILLGCGIECWCGWIKMFQRNELPPSMLQCVQGEVHRHIVVKVFMETHGMGWGSERCSGLLFPFTHIRFLFLNFSHGSGWPPSLLSAYISWINSSPYTLQPWRQRCYDCLKCRYQPTRQHGVTFQKAVTAMEIPKLTLLYIIANITLSSSFVVVQCVCINGITKSDDRLRRWAALKCFVVCLERSAAFLCILSCHLHL